MAGISSNARFNTTINLKRIHGVRCCSVAPDKRTPKILKFAVSGVTELLRLFSSSSAARDRLDAVSSRPKEEISVSGVDDVVMVLKSDYENAYFVTGIFTSSLYAEDCIFEDPTIRFQGTELYARNLRLLVPFFDQPSIGLQDIKKGIDSEKSFVLATWKLRTYLKLPWRPLISIDGKTVYDLDSKFKIVRHAESWNVSALQAIGQIFTPSFGRPAYYYAGVW
ncbi:uncharacterized protein LOC110809630 isoform X2 [Carica papaya]|uniref:uncharacterized protein LOC110809630 isoform X2 n=1 Tax=Carica papaya TaxID=3649 RepID=UPI000B8C9C38|nr:uncharacterized protein LOC110809630 isoform X2 [Carica papaya]